MRARRLETQPRTPPPGVAGIAAARWRGVFPGCWTGLLALTLFPGAAPIRAQDNAAAAGNFSLESDVRAATVGSAEFRERANVGSLNSDNIGTRDVLSYKANEAFLIRFGLEYDHYTFYEDGAPPLPNKLQDLNLVVGADLQLGDAWIVRADFEPGFYGQGKAIRGRALDYPVLLGASYFWSSDLQIVAGLSIDPERNYPVLPGLGFRYQLNSSWVADFVLPTPRLEYNYSKSLVFYGGGEIQSNSYRLEGDFGTTHGDPRLNNAIVDYDQIRVGVGASWKIHKLVTLEMEAGLVPIQEFDFHRVGIRARETDKPPYGGLVLKFDF